MFELVAQAPSCTPYSSRFELAAQGPSYRPYTFALVVQEPSCRPCSCMFALVAQGPSCRPYTFALVVQEPSCRPYSTRSWPVVHEPFCRLYNTVCSQLFHAHSGYNQCAFHKFLEPKLFYKLFVTGIEPESFLLAQDDNTVFQNNQTPSNQADERTW